MKLAQHYYTGRDRYPSTSRKKEKKNTARKMYRDFEQRKDTRERVCVGEKERERERERIEKELKKYARCKRNSCNNRNCGIMCCYGQCFSQRKKTRCEITRSSAPRRYALG